MAKIRICRNAWFYVPYYVYIVYNMLRTTLIANEIDRINAFVYLLVITLLCIKIFLDAKDKLLPIQIVGIMGGIISASVVAVAWQKLVPLVLVLFFIAMKNVDFRSLANSTIRILIFFLLAVFALYKTGISGTTLDALGRDTMGFTYPTVCSHFFLTVVLLIVYLRKNRVKTWQWVAIICINIYIYYITKARNSFGLVIILFMISMTLKVLPVLKKYFYSKLLADYSIILAIVVSAFMALYDSSSTIIGKVLDDITSGRLHLMRQAAVKYGFPLFGSNIIWRFENEETYNYIDNSFYQICLLYGVFFLGVICFGTVMAMKCFRLKREYYIILIFNIIFLHSIFDPQYIQLAYNPFILLIGECMWRTREKHKMKENILFNKGDFSCQSIF